MYNSCNLSLLSLIVFPSWGRYNGAFHHAGGLRNKVDMIVRSSPDGVEYKQAGSLWWVGIVPSEISEIFSIVLYKHWKRIKWPKESLPTSHSTIGMYKMHYIATHHDGRHISNKNLLSQAQFVTQNNGSHLHNLYRSRTQCTINRLTTYQ